MDWMRRLKQVVLHTTALLEKVIGHDAHPPGPCDEAETDVILLPASFLFTILTSGLCFHVPRWLKWTPPRTVGEFQLSIKQWGKEVKEIKEWELKAYVGSNKMAALQQKWRGFLLLISASHSIKIVWILTGSYFFYFSKIHSINGLQSRPYLFSGRVGLNLHSPGIMNYFCIQAGNVN